MPIRAIIYIRVSSTKQQHGQSLDEQEWRAVDYAMREFDFKREELKIFVEVYTGTKVDRPDFERMMDFAEKHSATVKKVIITEIDRFTRAGVPFYEEAKSRLVQLGIQLVDINGVIQPSRNHLQGTGRGFGKDLEYDWSYFSPSEGEEARRAQESKSERRTILIRTIPKLVENIKHGYEAREAGYGFCNDKIIDPETGLRRAIRRINPDEARYIRRMFELKAAGVDNRQICDILNKEGFRTRSRNTWVRDKNGRKICSAGTRGQNPMSIYQIPRYFERVSYVGFKCEKWTWGKLIRAKHDPIISIDLWNRANQGKQQIVPNPIEPDEFIMVTEQKLKRGYTTFNPDFPLKQVLHCPQCERKVKGAFFRGKSGKRFPLYYCNRQHKQISLNPNALKDIFQEECKKRSLSKRASLLFVSGLRQVWRQQNSSALHNQIERERQIEELNNEAEKLVNVLGQLTVPALIQKTEQKYQEIQDKIALLHEEKANKIVRTEVQLERDLAFCRNLVEHLDELLLNPQDQRILRDLWSMVFPIPPTLQNIQERTLEWSPLIKHKEMLMTTDFEVVCQKATISNTLLEEFEQWLALIQKIRTIQDF